MRPLNFSDFDFDLGSFVQTRSPTACFQDNSIQRNGLIWDLNRLTSSPWDRYLRTRLPPLRIQPSPLPLPGPPYTTNDFSIQAKKTSTTVFANPPPPPPSSFPIKRNECSIRVNKNDHHRLRSTPPPPPPPPRLPSPSPPPPSAHGSGSSSSSGHLVSTFVATCVSLMGSASGSSWRGVCNRRKFFSIGRSIRFHAISVRYDSMLMSISIRSDRMVGKFRFAAGGRCCIRCPRTGVG